MKQKNQRQTPGLMAMQSGQVEVQSGTTPMKTQTKEVMKIQTEVVVESS